MAAGVDRLGRVILPALRFSPAQPPSLGDPGHLGPGVWALMAALDILYYGRLRDQIGLDREAVDIPSHVLTVRDLLDWLRGQGEPHAAAIGDGEGIGAAVAGEWAARDDSLFGAVEVVLFPPRGVL